MNTVSLIHKDDAEGFTRQLSIAALLLQLMRIVLGKYMIVSISSLNSFYGIAASSSSLKSSLMSVRPSLFFRFQDELQYAFLRGHWRFTWSRDATNPAPSRLSI